MRKSSFAKLSFPAPPQCGFYLSGVLHLAALANRYCDKYLIPLMYLVVNFFTLHLDIFRRINPKLNLTVSIAEYRYLDIVVDDNGFVLTSGEYEHWFLRPWVTATMPDSSNTD